MLALLKVVGPIYPISEVAEVEVEKGKVLTEKQVSHVSKICRG